MDSKIREFREDDIPELLEIAKTTWEGHDHLPGMLKHWMSNSNCNPFVMELDGKVVSVANLKVIDQGKTGWMEGLRVHPDFREQGLAALMTNHIVDVASAMKLPKIRLVTATENLAPRKLAESVDMSIIGQYSVFWKGWRRNFKWTYEVDSVKRMESSDVLEFAQSHPELLPNTTLIHLWDVFDLTRKNVDVIAKTAEFWSGEESSASLSSGFQHDTRYGPEWCFTIYATTPDAFLSNLSVHLNHARDLGIKILMCIHPPDFEEQYQNVKWLKRRNHGIQLLLFERVLS
ncbi:MAG: GNAT family N-acetyltransferase [Candidatus Thorarchaeota archaeon]|nr:MAG: GNAT family N-acetyltransferase [Candidatus Thorarchaeota archaeon]